VEGATLKSHGKSLISPRKCTWRFIRLAEFIGGIGASCGCFQWLSRCVLRNGAWSELGNDDDDDDDDDDNDDAVDDDDDDDDDDIYYW